MRPSLFVNRESPARRIGVILSVLFLAALGTVATITNAHVGDHEQTEAPVAIAALPSAAAR